MSKRIHYRTCNLCEAMCGIEIELKNEKITGIRGDKNDLFSQGHICPKAVALQDIHYDKDRLKSPLKRTPTGWQNISWDEAIHLIATQLNRIRKDHGPNAVGIYTGNPPSHNYGSALLYIPLLLALGTRNRYSASSVDQRPFQLACFLMFGHQALMPVPDIDRTNYFLILGANPLVSNGSIMSAGGVGKKMDKILQRNGKIIVIDPRHTETARMASEHHFIRPETDTFLLLAMLNTLFRENLVNLGRLEKFTDGVLTVKEMVKDWTPEYVANATGISSEVIIRITREFAQAQSAVCYGRIGTCTQELGTLASWLIVVLNILTGNLDRPGGSMFTLAAFDLISILANTGEKGHFANWFSRVQKLPEFGDELPVAALQTEILTAGEGQIRAMIINGGNPVLSTPNGNRLDQAFSQLDFMLSIDLYLNETSRHAHVILPPTGHLEHGHYDILYSNYMIRNFAKFSPALFAKQTGTMHDYEIFAKLVRKLNPSKRPNGYVDSLKAKLLSLLHPNTILNFGLLIGPYGLRRGFKALTLGKLKRNSHGLDFGPLKSCLPARLGHKSRRINLTPDLITRDIERAKKIFAQTCDSEYPFKLISRRQLRGNNSWMHNYQRLVKGKNPCVALIHPQDAETYAIIAGSEITISSKIGSINIAVEITPDVMPKTINIPHGFGHGRLGVQTAIAQTVPGVSINDIIDDLRVDTPSSTSAFNGMPVKIKVCTK